MQKMLPGMIISATLFLSIVLLNATYAQNCGKCDGAGLKNHQEIPDNRVSAAPNTLRISQARARLDRDSVVRPQKTDYEPPPQTAGAVAHPGQPLPGSSHHANYQTFSLFLITDPKWASNKSDLTMLKQVYENFADQIGQEHLAVWFVGDTPNSIDVQRAATYCQKLNISEKHGPYVIQTTVNPDKTPKIETFLKIQLEGMDVQGVIQVLNILERDLLTHRLARQDITIQLEEVKQVLLTSIKDHGLKGIVVAFEK